MNQQYNSNEIQILKQFRSPYIIKYFDDFTDTQFSYYLSCVVTEYCQVSFDINHFKLFENLYLYVFVL